MGALDNMNTKHFLSLLAVLGCVLDLGQADTSAFDKSADANTDTDPDPADGNIRQTNGFLEVFHSSVWKGVCDDFFDVEDARVVCRQMGQLQTGVDPVFTTMIANSDDDYWLDDLNCTGTETTLADCPRRCDFFSQLSTSAWAGEGGCTEDCHDNGHVLVDCNPRTCLQYSGAASRPASTASVPACASTFDNSLCRVACPATDTKCFDMRFDLGIFGTTYSGGCASTCTANSYTTGSSLTVTGTSVTCCDTNDCNLATPTAPAASRAGHALFAVLVAMQAAVLSF